MFAATFRPGKAKRPRGGPLCEGELGGGGSHEISVAGRASVSLERGNEKGRLAAPLRLVPVRYVLRGWIGVGAAPDVRVPEGGVRCLRTVVVRLRCRRRRRTRRSLLVLLLGFPPHIGYVFVLRLALAARHELNERSAIGVDRRAVRSLPDVVPDSRGIAVRGGCVVVVAEVLPAPDVEALPSVGARHASARVRPLA